MTGLEIPDVLMRRHGARARWLRKPFEAARLLALLPAHAQHPGPPTVPHGPARRLPETPWIQDSR
jgi:hypothetical protein